MHRYRTRPRVVDAMQFDGTGSGVERLLAWLASIAPGFVLRPRTEYAGWDDQTGHLELEAKGLEHGCMAGDWVVVTQTRSSALLDFLDDVSFKQQFEAVPS